MYQEGSTKMRNEKQRNQKQKTKKFENKQAAHGKDNRSTAQVNGQLRPFISQKFAPNLSAIALKDMPAGSGRKEVFQSGKEETL